MPSTQVSIQSILVLKNSYMSKANSLKYCNNRNGRKCGRLAKLLHHSRTCQCRISEWPNAFLLTSKCNFPSQHARYTALHNNAGFMIFTLKVAGLPYSQSCVETRKEHACRNSSTEETPAALVYNNVISGPRNYSSGVTQRTSAASNQFSSSFNRRFGTPLWTGNWRPVSGHTSDPSSSTSSSRAWWKLRRKSSSCNISSVTSSGNPGAPACTCQHPRSQSAQRGLFDTAGIYTHADQLVNVH